MDFLLGLPGFANEPKVSLLHSEENYPEMA